MQRMPSTLALSAWAGFGAVSSALLLREAGLLAEGSGGAAGTITAALPLPLGLATPDAAAFAAILAALVVGLGATIAWLHAESGGPAGPAETVAASLLTAIFGLYVAASVSGSPLASLFGDGPGFLFALALSFGALLFDHLVAPDDTGDREFEAAMRAIEAARRDALARREQRHSSESDKG
ncbi:hypothetical protein [Aurantimonas endophytica]|uniref:Uncharacterized protein n=1 Tax=Aurantimonas endophytica TaxID=1522175 RepID=A0A7W6HB58_9HYPH|nr:hypothetical protein [Aurantimonas endophytica]MBB4001678.1 hypothetical protein [Aurantimonas endophytica]MCO6402685.1 hypothetical protein [Aurantimonas endophytica]